MQPRLAPTVACACVARVPSRPGIICLLPSPWGQRRKGCTADAGL